VSDGALSQDAGMMIGAASVLVYTLFGGMWSVAVTDFIQMIIIVVGMLYIGYEVSGQAGARDALRIGKIIAPRPRLCRGLNKAMGQPALHQPRLQVRKRN
ncbi:hypothetical protein R0K04_22490, partial [Pseudoalteromonas sp. SIMBA_153]